MTFAEKLKTLMNELHLTQRNVAEMTGISASSISQYLNGRNEPYKARKREMALALGVQETYFDDFLPTPKVQNNSPVKIKPELVARLLHKSKKFITQGLQEGRFPWGYAVQTSPERWNYFNIKLKDIERERINVIL